MSARGNHLRSVGIRRAPKDESFPFSVPTIRSLAPLDVDVPVAFFVGENGSGKSTLMEGIAIAAGLPTVGSLHADQDRTLDAQRRLAKALVLGWQRRTHRGFFLRAEDFFGFAKSIATLRGELLQRLGEIREEYRDRSDYARGLAEGPIHASIGALEAKYGVDLDANSHGESFLRLFRSRFIPDGLYLLDEPEAALSPRSQLALLAMLGDMVGQGSQFIIATHSPILLSYPGARIFSFDESPVSEVPYDRLEHVTLTREFLAEPGRFLRHLLDPAEAPAE